jgi:16S rRNA (guanine527-N7)-methyltransferase
LGFASRHLVPDGTAIFPKGRTAAEEVLKARQDWVFDLTETPSKTDPDAKLLMIKGIARAET